MAAPTFINPSQEWNQKGNAAHAEENFQSAREFYTRALRFLKENPYILFNLGGVFHKLGQYEKAEATYQHALELTKEKRLQSDLYYNLGNHYLETSQYKKAIQSYRLALTLNDKDLKTKKNLEISLARHKENKAPTNRSATTQNEEKNQRNEEGRPNPSPGKQFQDNRREPRSTLESQRESPNPLTEGNDEALSSPDEENLPTEAQHTQQSQKQFSEQERISRKRANEILENFEEQHSNLRNLNYYTPPPPSTREKNTW